MLKNNIVIAIDGPAGSGKSSIAKIIAKKFSFLYIDTGAMYRALTLKVINLKIDINDQKAIQNLVNSTTISYDKDENLLIDKKLVTDAIRQQKITDLVKKIASSQIIRTFLVDMQRIIGKQKNSIIDGRDIGTVVFPDADLKIFLTSSVEVRAQRRLLQNQENNINLNYNLNEIKTMISIRDQNDTNRKIGALKIAQDGILVDSSKLTFKETEEKIINLMKQKGVINEK